MAHSVSGYVLYVSMWFNTKFVRVPKILSQEVRHKQSLFIKNYYSLMLKNYLITALRHFWRNRLYAFINIFSLSIGISASMLIFIYLRSEWRYDTQHPNASCIYRIPLEIKSESTTDRLAVNNFLLACTLKAYYPKEITNFVRVLPVGRQTVTIGGRTFNEDKVSFTDQSLLEVFDIKLLIGDPKTALKDSLTAIISEATAIKYFGVASLAIGKKIQFPVKKYLITGVMKTRTHETHLQSTIYLSSNSVWKGFIEQCKNDLTLLTTYNYIVLNKSVQASAFQKKLSDEYAQYTAPWYKLSKTSAKSSIKYLLQPVQEIHLDMQYEGEQVPAANPTYLYILSLICMFILLMACINYMNLATARAGQRAREVGLRKVLGASRRQLLGQFLGESFVLSFLSIWLGLAIAEILLPNFNYLTGRLFVQLPWNDAEFWFVLLVIMLSISVLAGLYPAIYLSSFPPTWILQNTGYKSWHLGRMWLNPANLRKGLVILQFSLSISMMIGTLVAYSQWDYMRTQPLGFQKDNVMVIDIPAGDSLLLKHLPAIQAKLKENPNVITTSVTSTVLDTRMPKLEHIIPQDNGLTVEVFNTISIDENFIQSLHIVLKEGVNFVATHPDSAQASVIINEAAAKLLGWKKPLGKFIGNAFLKRIGHGQSDTTYCEVIGVVKDFHYQSLQRKIEPMVMFYLPQNPGFLLVKTKAENSDKTQAWVRKIWQDLDKKHPMEYFDLAQYIESRYEPEGKLVTIFSYFSLLAIVISGLGLLGLTSYLTEQRTKEISIRRVLGASAGEIVKQFALEFVWLVAFAFLLASPVVYVLMLRWLQNFAYHAQPKASHFLLAGISALFMAVVTVSWLTWIVAKRKPGSALRYGG